MKVYGVSYMKPKTVYEGRDPILLYERIVVGADNISDALAKAKETVGALEITEISLKGNLIS
jgi:hypothetical protein